MMNDSHDFDKTGKTERKDGQKKSENSSRRVFLRKAGFAGAAAGLAHFVLLGKKAEKAYAYPAACGTTASTTDACALTSPTTDNDICNANDYDTCFGNGNPGVDICSPPLGSPDKCLTGAAAYDTCSAASPDVPVT